MGESFPQIPQKDPRQEALEAIQEGRATPTPEFAASETGLKYGPSTPAIPESEQAITRDAMGNTINSMTAEELDAFIKHVENLLPTVKKEANVLYKEAFPAGKYDEEAFNTFGVKSVTAQELGHQLEHAKHRKQLFESAQN